MIKKIYSKIQQSLQFKDRHWGDRFFEALLWIFSAGLLFLLIAMMAKLYIFSKPIWEKFGFSFFWSQEWDPVTENFGALPFIYGTVATSLLALLISVPVSISVALFLVELVHKKLGNIFSFLVELLAAIPSVVYGLWGVFVLAPLMRTHVQPFLVGTLGKIPGIGELFRGPAYGIGILTAGVILAIMITPTISSLCREIFKTVPLAQREGALALGATRWEMIKIAVLGSSYRGMMGAVVLGLGRALGETMAVTMVIGNRNEILFSLFAPGQTMASLIANEYAEAAQGLHLYALSAVGFSLFLVSLLINGIAKWALRRRG